MSNDLKQRWMRLCQRLGINDHSMVDFVFGVLTACYSEAHRRYHTLEHVAYCLRELDTVRDLAEDVDAVEMGLWFHDGIYDTKAPDNEERSALFFDGMAKLLGLPAPFTDKVHFYIVATKHDKPITNYDAQLVVDIDLASLAAPEAQFRQNTQNIREEYAWVPEEQFNAARADILRAFLKRPHIYQTEVFRGKYEMRARRNLERSINELSQKPSA